MSAAPHPRGLRPTTAEGAVMCIDDDPVVQILLGDVVRTAGAEYHSATTAQEAEEILASRSFDLVLLDRRLPDTDGLLLIRTIRRQSNCPVIVLSEYADTRDRVLGMGMGAAEYITKPFSPAELSRRIRTLLLERSRARALSRTLGRGRLAFVPGSRRLTVDGRASFVPPAEARLLHLLLENEDQVLSRDHLTRHACGRDWSPGDRTVDVLIARLRKRLPADVARIVTVHRAGYLFCIAPGET